MTQQASEDNLSIDLDAQLDEILTRLENAVARDVTMRTIHHSATRSPKSVHRDAKQALTKLIADRERKARIEEIRMILVWHGSNMPQHVVDELRNRKASLEQERDGSES